MLISTLPLLEARASSEIENIVTTTDKLFRHIHDEGRADPATKEALRYRHALMEGYATLRRRPLSTRTAEEICTRIRGVEMRVRRLPGTTLADAVTGAVVYTPPVGEELLRELLADWEGFMNASTELDPLIRMAVGHYQFEAIHPFTDGNGRTGRILNSLYLVQQGLLHLPVLYLSRHIIDHKAEYYRLLRAVTREDDWETWILFMLEAVEETSRWTMDKIAAIRSLSAVTIEFVRDRLPKIYTRELVDLLFEQPYCRISQLVKAGIAKRETASRYLRELARLGVLEERKVGRDKLFIHSRLMALLVRDSNAFAPFET
jgi:Fic family protein